MVSTMRKTLAIFLIAAGAICIFGAPAAANHTGEKYTICHRTNSDQNPYVVITPDEAAVDGDAPAKGDHYLEHQGPVWNPTLKDQKIEWGDIIPPVPGHHAGLNWTAEGQAIYNNGCAPAPPGTTTTTSTSTTTTSTTVIEPTTTTVAPEPTTTVSESTTTTVVPSETTTTVEQPELIPTVVITNDSTPRRGTLPVTGSGTTALTILGVILILIGTSLSLRYRTIQR